MVEVRDIQYVPGGDPAQALDLYLPENSGDTPAPVIVFIHGGGWFAGKKTELPGPEFFPPGCAIASIEYRLSQTALFPAQIQDCQAAVRWLRANSRKYNLDASRFGAWGGSAGGHLAVMLGAAGGKGVFPAIGGNADQSDRVQAVCDWCGPCNLNTVMKQAAEDPNVKNTVKFHSAGDPYTRLIGVNLGTDVKKQTAASPIHYLSKDTPPVVIVHGTVDASVPLAQSEELADALKKAGVPVIFQRLPGTAHGGPAFYLPAVRDLIIAFFEKYLKQTDVKLEVLPPSAVTIEPVANSER